jgi:hypothetical protein
LPGLASNWKSSCLRGEAGITGTYYYTSNFFFLFFFLVYTEVLFIFLQLPTTAAMPWGISQARFYLWKLVPISEST